MTRTRLAIAGLSVVVVAQALAGAWLWLSRSDIPTTLTVEVTSAGVPLTGVEGRVIVHQRDEPKVPYASGVVGQELALAPGIYNVKMVLVGAADAPSGWLKDVHLAPGEEGLARIEVAVGELMASVDAPATGTVLIQVFEEGKHERVIWAMAPDERVLLSTGRYDLRVTYLLDTEEKDVRWVEGLEVAAGLPTTSHVSFPRSRLLVHAVNNGRVLDPATVEVTVYRAGDDMLEILETGLAGIAIELSPGVYQVEARLTAAADKPVRAIESLELHKGALIEGRVQFETALVRTEVRLTGGERLANYEAYVYFYRAGDHEQAVAYAPAGHAIVLSTGTYDLRASLFRSADQPDLWVRGVNLAAGEDRLFPFSFPSGKLIVRAFDESGEELIGDNVHIRVYPNDARGIPLVRARAGELVIVSAGMYDIAVEDTRTARVQWLEDTVVSAGAQREPQLVFKPAKLQ